jgi:RNA polymerase sigma-70 factor, ECF subfamily
MAAKPNPEAEFREFYHANKAKVYAFTLNILKDPEEARLAANDVFIRIERGFERFRGEALLSTWIFRIGVNVCRERMKLNQRYAKRAPVKLDDLGPAFSDPLTNPSADFENRDTLDAIRIYAKTLPGKHGEMLMLRIFDGLDYKEISALLNVPSGSVASGVSRALKKIEKKFGKLEGGQKP